MSDLLSAMHKKSAFCAGGRRPWRLTASKCPAYAYSYVPPTMRRQPVLLLLCNAGVWVGLSEILPTHPATRVGFIFHPRIRAGSRERAVFRNFNEEIEEGDYL
jgi:hypothetical protein